MEWTWKLTNGYEKNVDMNEKFWASLLFILHLYGGAVISKSRTSLDMGDFTYHISRMNLHSIGRSRAQLIL